MPITLKLGSRVMARLDDLLFVGEIRGWIWKTKGDEEMLVYKVKIGNRNSEIPEADITTWVAK